MTNEQYRRKRGTRRKFQTTEAQARELWYAMNKEAIDRRRAIRAKSGHKRRPWNSDMRLDED